MTDIKHGGRIDEAVARYGGLRSKWIDLSTGINPKPHSVPEIHPSAFRELPDQQAQRAAIEAVRRACGADETAEISLAPGTQIHIQILPFLFKPQDVAIVGFTYQEHSICWQRAGHSIFVTDGLESAEATARIIIVVNPNNPDGRQFEHDQLTGLARRLASKGGLLVVDESFAETVPEISVCDETGRDGLLVLRSLGKFYGLAGVRFGAALGATGVIRRLDDRLGPWVVSGPALEVATKVLDDKRWRVKTIKSLAAKRLQLEAVLDANGLERIGGTSLFVLVRSDFADRIHKHLAKAHILVRDFSERPDWLRFGLPGSKPELKRLDKALKSCPVSG